MYLKVPTNSNETIGTNWNNSCTTKMPRSCHFPNAVHERDISQRYLIKLTKEESSYGASCVMRPRTETLGTEIAIITCVSLIPKLL